MNSKMTTNSQLSTTEPKKQKNPKQTTRTGTELQKWRSHGGLLVGWGWGRVGGKGTGNNKHNTWHKIGEVKNSMGNGEAKELICTTHGHKVRGQVMLEGGEGCREEGDKGEKKIGTTAIA